MLSKILNINKKENKYTASPEEIIKKAKETNLMNKVVKNRTTKIGERCVLSLVLTVPAVPSVYPAICGIKCEANKKTIFR